MKILIVTSTTMCLKYKKIFIVVDSDLFFLKFKTLNFVELENLRKNGYIIEMIKKNVFDTHINIKRSKENIDRDFIENKKTILKIEKIRAKNNSNWMKILLLAFKHAPEEARKIIADVSDCDKEINLTLQKLGKKE